MRSSLAAQRWSLLFWTLVTLSLLLMCLRLAWWQWSKGQDKLATRAKIVSAAEQSAVPLAAWWQDAERLSDDALWQRWQHKRLSINGSFAEHKAIFLDNQIYNGQAGYYVYGVFTVASLGQTRGLLINLGWLPQGNDRQQLPTVTPWPKAAIKLSGYINPLPKKRISLGTVDENDWARLRWPYLDLARVEAVVGYTLLPAVVYADDSTPLGYKRDWAPTTDNAYKNLAYALQWLGFALSALALWGYVFFYKPRQTRHNR